MTKFQRFCLLWAIFNLLIMATACGNWTTQASAIIGMLVPAINAALAILAAFGLGVPPSVLTAVQQWGATAQTTLTNVVQPLIDAYNNAADGAKTQLLDQIKSALDSLTANLQQVFAAVHITNPNTQAKVAAIFALIEAQLVALINLVPVLQGKVTDHAQAKKAVNAVKTAEHFKEDFNQVAESFGAQYTI